NQQRFRFRHRRGSAPAPAPAGLIPRIPAALKRARPWQTPPPGAGLIPASAEGNAGTRDRGARGGPPPAPGPAGQMARVGTVSGFGIVGTGVIAALHAAAIATLSGARLAAVTDVVAEAATAFAAACGCAAEPSLDALLARPDVDVLCVCVPSGQHA